MKKIFWESGMFREWERVARACQEQPHLAEWGIQCPQRELSSTEQGGPPGLSIPGSCLASLLSAHHENPRPTFQACPSQKGLWKRCPVLQSGRSTQCLNMDPSKGTSHLPPSRKRDRWEHYSDASVPKLYSTYRLRLFGWHLPQMEFTGTVFRCGLH